jgi:sulfoacetaldehyde dehydrogenase
LTLLSQAVLWVDGILNAEIVAQSPHFIAQKAGFESEIKADAKFFIVPETGWGAEYPFSGEKMIVALTLYHAR